MRNEKPFSYAYRAFLQSISNFLKIILKVNLKRYLSQETMNQKENVGKLMYDDYKEQQKNKRKEEDSISKIILDKLDNTIKAFANSSEFRNLNKQGTPFYTVGIKVPTDIISQYGYNIENLISSVFSREHGKQYNLNSCYARFLNINNGTILFEINWCLPNELLIEEEEMKKINNSDYKALTRHQLDDKTKELISTCINKKYQITPEQVLDTIQVTAQLNSRLNKLSIVVDEYTDDLKKQNIRLNTLEHFKNIVEPFINRLKKCCCCC